MLTATEILILSLLAPVAVYGLARLIFAAYFITKANFLRRFFHGTDQTKNPGTGDE